ncbi:MAG TPA: anti-sigma regulatory factor [Roseiflexaceae bacterium]|nr:anti-sigma regulatory factor [Roseiflexaceae bacterium]
MRTVVCTIAREADVYVAMVRAREFASALGFDDIERTRIEIAVLELTRNVLAHAVRGEMTLEEIARNTRRGLAVTVRDQGPGIADVELAMRDGFSTKHTLGAGLPGVKRLMDEFEIETTLGSGTRIRVTKWVTPSNRGSAGRRLV